MALIKEQRNPKGAFIQEMVFTLSTTFTPAMDCYARIFVLGGGGSGAASLTPVVTSSSCATGGGAGAFCCSEVRLSASTAYTVTVGAGGAAVTENIEGVEAGIAGGNSVFSGTGITTITANGGAGGTAAINAGATNLTGAAGGTGSGGNKFNLTGGAAGDADAVDSTSRTLSASGGGAPAIFGEGYRGGHANTTNTGSQRFCASGGAGIGGRGGDATLSSSAGDCVSQAGGTGGPGKDITDAVTTWSNSNESGVTYAVSTTDYQHDSIFSGLKVAAPTTEAVGGRFGCGSCGGRGSVSTAGWFGGGGGSMSDGIGPNAGRGGYGGGGGGAIRPAGSGTAASGAGGGGLVVIQILEYL